MNLQALQNRPPQSQQYERETDVARLAQSRSVPARQMQLRVACVIPCFNEALVLHDTLASVLAAGLSPEDVLVVDDCSSDETSQIAERAGVGLLRNVRNLGKSKSLARAIDELTRLGRHEFLSVLDADTLADPEYFRTVVRAFQADRDVVLVCGQPRSRRHNWLTAFRAAEYAVSHRVYKQAQQKVSAITVAPGCSSTYRMTVLKHLEWNPAILTEDADATVQVYRKNLGRVVYEKRAIVHTQDPGTIRALRGQLHRWYTGYWQVVVSHRLPFGGQRIDAEFALLAGEGLLFGILLSTLPLWLLASPELVGYYLLADQILSLSVASVVAMTQRRIDVIAYAPLFIVPRLMISFIFLITFIQIVVLRQNAAAWFSPPRYVSPSSAMSTLRVGESDV
jgi:cellulose synthase/poly-beta-1,6-N-acetylglucosamine synthase-like glycosyltransferase